MAHLVCECNKEYNYSNKFVMGDTIMSAVEEWAKRDYENIIGMIQNKQYTELLVLYKEKAKLSETKAAALFGCSRRSVNRYLTGTRKVPLSIVRYMINSMSIEIHEEDNKDEFNEYGSFIWYGDDNMLLNTLYGYRVKKCGWTRFEAASRFNITEQQLKAYENGTKSLTPTIIKKAMNIYDLKKINDLYPYLVSFDGGNNYVPLKFVSEIYINGERFDLIDDEKSLYIDPYDCPVNKFPNFPIYKYSPEGLPTIKYQMNELSIDEYMNTSEFFFEIEETGNFFEMDTTNIKLPPVYKHMLSVYGGKDRSFAKYEGYEKQLKNLILTDDYMAIVKSGSHTMEFDLSDYVFSDSPWYSMLRDKEYFKSGRLEYIGDEIAQNQCIVWKDGQYVRFIELYIDKYPRRHFAEAIDLISRDEYDMWTRYYPS